jgi:hypothetical protein
LWSAWGNSVLRSFPSLQLRHILILFKNVSLLFYGKTGRFGYKDIGVGGLFQEDRGALLDEGVHLPFKHLKTLLEGLDCIFGELASQVIGELGERRADLGNRLRVELFRVKLQGLSDCIDCLILLFPLIRITPFEIKQSQV